MKQWGVDIKLVDMTNNEWAKEEGCITWCRVVEEIAEVSRKLVETLQGSNTALSENEAAIVSLPKEITSVEQLRTVINNVVWVIRRQQEENAKTTASVQAVVEKLEKENHSLQKDKLTGLLNRHTFWKHFKKVDSLYKSEREPFCIATLDIDHFKKINDEYTHMWGDEALKFIATVLRMVFKEEEVFRFGGEEFIILNKWSNGEMVWKLKYVYSYLQKNAFSYRDKSCYISFSGWLAVVKEGDSAKTMLERSDVNMYKAKQSWRNRIVTD